MLNMIKMDIYRLFQSKSMYAIWMILAFFLLSTTFMTKTDMAAMEGEVTESQVEEPEEEVVEVGISVEMPTKPGEKVTVYDEFYANTQGKVMALFIVIFTVLFSTADLTSGYIKNIAGQVKDRWKMILSKTLSVFLYIVMTLGLSILWQALCHLFILGYVKFGDGQQFFTYFAVQVFLHFALALICMAVAVFLRNNVISMIFSVCLCLNFLAIIYSLIDKFVHKWGKEDFSIINYTVTGKISLLPWDLTRKDGVGALLVSAVFILVMTVFTSIVFEKRDVV